MASDLCISKLMPANLHLSFASAFGARGIGIGKGKKWFHLDSRFYYFILSAILLEYTILPEGFGDRGGQCTFSMLDKENQSSIVQVQTCWVKTVP